MTNTQKAGLGKTTAVGMFMGDTAVCGTQDFWTMWLNGARPADEMNKIKITHFAIIIMMVAKIFLAFHQLPGSVVNKPSKQLNGNRLPHHPQDLPYPNWRIVFTSQTCTAVGKNQSYCSVDNPPLTAKILPVETHFNQAEGGA